MSYIDTVKSRVRKRTELGKLLDMQTLQEKRQSLDKQIRKQLAKAKSTLQGGDHNLARDQMYQLDTLFSQYLIVHQQCMDLIEDSSQKTKDVLTMDEIDKEYHLFKREFFELLYSPLKDIPFDRSYGATELPPFSTVMKPLKASSSRQASPSSTRRESTRQASHQSPREASQHSSIQPSHHSSRQASPSSTRRESTRQASHQSPREASQHSSIQPSHHSSRQASPDNSRRASHQSHQSPRENSPRQASQHSSQASQHSSRNATQHSSQASQHSSRNASQYSSQASQHSSRHSAKHSSSNESSKHSAKHSSSNESSKHSAKHSSSNESSKHSAKRSSKGSGSSHSSNREAIAQSRARIAELEVEAAYEKKREELERQQKAVAREMEVAKERARLSMLEKGRSHEGKLSLPSISESAEQKVAKYVESLPTAINLEPERQFQENVVKTLQLPEIEIEPFSGNPLEFSFFMASFTETVEANTTSQSGRYMRLIQYLSGEPKQLVQGYINRTDCYSAAKQTLKDHYGDQYKILNEYKKELKSWGKIKPNETSSLKKFYAFLMKFRSTFSDEIYDTPELIQLLHSKLPTYIQDRWNRSALKIRAKRCEPSLTDFLELLQTEIQLATDPLYSREATQLHKDQQPSKKEPSSGRRHTSYRTEIRPSTCPICASQHDIDDCVTFLQNTFEERKRMLYKRRLCFACYLPINEEHNAKTCKNKRKCKLCKLSHPTGLHVRIRQSRDNTDRKQSRENDRRQPRDNSDNRSGQPKDSPEPESVGTKRTITKSNVVSLCVIPVEIQSKSGGSIKTHALLDNGSQTSFIKTSIAKQLKLPSNPTTIKIRTLTGEQKSECQMVNGAIVANISTKENVQIPLCYTQDEIHIEQGEIPTPSKIQGWKHLNHLSQHLPEDDKSIEIGILIGGNCPEALEPLSVISSETKQGPYAYKTKLGWCILGPIEGTKSSGNPFCHNIAVKDVTNDSPSSHYFCVPNRVVDESIHQDLLRMYHHDFNQEGDTLDQPSKSQEDNLFLDIMENGVTKIGNHYQLPLPFRNPEIQLENNKSQAFQRAKWLKQKLLRNSKMHNDYVTSMQTLIEKGYARKVEPSDLDTPDGRVWYLPHFGVYHPKKPDKLRVVLDCSASFKGYCLNKELLQGPDLTNTLFGVLLRFRQHNYAVMADVETMFYQVLVPPDQHNFLRLLWWQNGNLQSPLQEYVMTVHIMGATSSPSVASLALQRTAQDNKSKFGKQAARTLQKNFYVDDMLESYETEPKAVKGIKGSVEMCLEGGFRLTKIVSNSRKVMNSIPKEEHGKSFKDLNIDNDTLPIERALGVHWCIENDTFGFRITLKDKPLTKRGILSTISSIYDPLGLAGPFVLQGKIILQQLCFEKKGWDESISQPHRVSWEKWRIDLPKLEDIQVDRCIRPKDFGKNVTFSVHHFSDASDLAYGEASYIRAQNENDDVHCTLLAAKSRVAPLKPTTIPRLELTAATVSAKVATSIRNELEIDQLPEFFWTDSEVVLGFLKNQKKRFHLFVTNRIQTIKNHSSEDQWRHVKGTENPADDTTRVLSIDKFLKQKRWFNGPEFLHQPLQKLEAMKGTFDIKDSDPEVKKVHRIIISEATTFLDHLTAKTSSWSKVKRLVCVIMQWRTKKAIDVKDLCNAERILVKLAQKQVFEEDITMLNNGISIKRKSSIYRLDPYLDDEGILRVGGRLSRSSSDVATTNPIILPKKNFITSLIVKDCHEAVKHSGRGLTIMEIRNRGFWVINCNSFVRNVISKCVPCRRLRGSTNNQKMADLPADRFEESPPFTICGVDYFGPFEIKERRKELKRYGALFTCFASRAVHIETSNSLETDSFILALRRFISRRGDVRTIHSDNGTNFVGAQNELKRAINEMDDEKIQTFLQMRGCDWIKWKKNPPSASHFGGVWERHIRTVRSILDSILMTHGTSLDEESFRTFMCETEAIINSRPLTVESLSDPQSMLPLSPANLLTMKSKVVVPPPGEFQTSDMYSKKRWRRVQHLLNEFWSRWRKEYLQSLQPRSKWNETKRQLRVGDVVLLKESNVRNDWKLSIVTEVFPDRKGNVRIVNVKNSNGTYKRPISKLVLLVENDDI